MKRIGPSPALLVLMAGVTLSAANAQNKAVPVEQRPAAQPSVVTPPTESGHESRAIEAAGDDDRVTLSAFAEPVSLQALIALVSDAMQVNISVSQDVPGQVVFNAPVAVKKEDLLPLLNSLLEQQGFSMTRDRFGFYMVQASGTLGPGPGGPGELASTRVFRTPNMRPSALKAHLDAVLAGGTTGAPRQYAYMDDLGIIIATDTPRKLDALGGVLDRVIAERARMEWVRMDLQHTAAPAARERVLQLIGQISQPVARAGQDANAAAQATAAASRPGGILDNLGERLTVAFSGNAVMFNGTPEEIERVRNVLLLIDVPGNLVPRSYEAGSSAVEIATIASGLGLGEVRIIANTGTAGGFENASGFLGTRRLEQGNQATTQGSSVGGPAIVVDQKQGRIVYYATESQQAQLAALLSELDTQAEQVVIRVYKLKNSKAEDMQEVLLGILQNQAIQRDSLLPGDEPVRPPRFSGRTQTNSQQNANQGRVSQPAGGDELSIDESNAFVIADIPNNQVIVKAPIRQQADFERLIERLDLRRAQVYIEAKIVAVTFDDQLRTAFETQLINASGTGGVFQQNFALTTAGTGGTQPILNPRVVAAGLTGFTGALIRSDQVPIVMTALANQTDSRVIATPQLLVDDNEKAKVATIDSQPVQVISRGTTGGTGDIITSGEDATAETSLEVTPHISDAGYMRMEYKVKLENFTGAASQGLSPPKQTNDIQADSITVPSDSTVVVGGLVVDTKRKTVAKIPILGDIPLAGLLFQDRSTTDRKTVLYIFLTPKILREPTFADLKLLTRGPQATAGLKPDVPALKPSRSEIVAPKPAAKEDGASPAKTSSGERRIEMTPVPR